MKIKFILWILLFILMAGLIVPEKIWAAGDTGNCGCGTYYEGGMEFCVSCQVGGGGDPDLTCWNDGPTNQCGGGWVSCPAGSHPDWTVSYRFCGAGMDVEWERVVGCCELMGEEGDTWCPGFKARREVGRCVADCNATTPTNLVYTTSSQSLSWTPGANGVSQRLYISADPNQVANNCSLGTSPGCIVNNTNATSPYSLIGLVSPGTVYYAKVVNYKNGACSSSTAVTPFLSSCSFSSPSTNIILGNSQVLNTTINNSSLVTRVYFSSSNSGIASVDGDQLLCLPDGECNLFKSDTTHPYSVLVRSVALGSANITLRAYFTNTLACTATAGVNVLTPDPWWQVKDGDTSSNGDLDSTVVLGSYFNLPGSGGYPGVPAYGASTNLTTSNVASSPYSWLVNSPNASQKTFGYKYFENLVPTTTVWNSVSPADATGSLASGGTADSKGYYWYKYEGNGVDLSLNTLLDLGSRKVILFVESANLLINAPIALTDGEGFFLVIVGKTETGAKGSIIVAPTVGV